MLTQKPEHYQDKVDAEFDTNKKIIGDIVFENLSFDHGNSNPVLRDVFFYFDQNHVALDNLALEIREEFGRNLGRENPDIVKDADLILEDDYETSFQGEGARLNLGCLIVGSSIWMPLSGMMPIRDARLTIPGRLSAR